MLAITFDNTPTDIDGFDNPAGNTQGDYNERFTMNILL